VTIDNENQLLQWKPPVSPSEIIGDGILFPGTTMMLFGAAGAWKTINTLHLVYCIASGKPWFGFETSPATVLSHQVELPKFLFRERFIKYKYGNQMTSPNIFFLTPSDDVLLDTTFGLGELAKTIEEVQRRAHNPQLPLVIALDPLMLYMSGHISDEYDVKKFQRNVNSLRRQYNITIIIVHHARLMRTDSAGGVIDLGAEEIMGSSYWNNWLDTIVRLKVTNPFHGSDTIHFDFGKTRNAQRFLPGFTVRWKRDTLVPELLSKDLMDEEEPTIRGLI